MFYNKLSENLKQQFGCKVYKICLSSGLGCPNRDGTCGTGGCVFCSEKGSGEFTENGKISIEQQISLAKQRVKNKTKDNKYIAYFQNFTNTYGKVEYLKNIFYKAIASTEIVALSVATRPDCLPDEVINLLAEINKIKPVWVELGLQTIHEKTAEYLRRGYKTEVYINAVKRLRAAGITVITHIILGLPNETPQMMLQTAKFVGEISNGIKIHMLYVTRGTDLEKEYLNGKIKLLEFEEYRNILAECMKVLPKQTVVHRITGDPPKQSLVAPAWTANKKAVLNSIVKYFNQINLEQGSNL